MTMNSSRRRAIAVLGAMTATAAAARWAEPTIHLADQGPKVDLEAWFPRQFAGWRVDDTLPIVIPSPDAQALLNKLYNQTLARTYVDSSKRRIMLSVAYGGDQSDATRSHRPEVCYPAQGFRISNNQAGILPLAEGKLRVRRLMSHLGGRHEPITYWIVVGQQVAISGTEQKLAQLRYGVRGLIPDGMLVRVSSIDDSERQGWALQQRFVQELDAALAPALRTRIVGEAAASAGTRVATDAPPARNVLPSPSGQVAPDSSVTR